MRTARFMLLLVCGACGPATAPADPDPLGSSSTAETPGSAATTRPDDDTSTGDPGGSEGSESTSASATSDGTTEAATTADPTSSAPECEQVAPGDWNRCWTGSVYDSSLCNWMGDPAAGPSPTCLMAALVENGSVCMLRGCEDRCDCFAPPTTGTATVECVEGIIANDTACVLYCGDGQTCPDGMVCGYQICVWEPQ